MKTRVHILYSFAFAVLTLMSCNKREARKDLKGDWVVTGYTGFLYDRCSDAVTYADLDNEVFGLVRFDERWMKRTYRLVSDSNGCYDFGHEDDLVRWKVIEYERQTSAAHYYTLEIDGRAWNLNFGNEAVGEYPDNQELIYLFHLSENGDAFAIELTREGD